MYCCVYASGNLPALLDCARVFSPLIEEHPDMVVFDIRGLEALHGPPAELALAVEREVGVPADIAIAGNPDAAIHAARGIAGITVIAPGNEAAILAPLPLNLIGASDQIGLSLDLWGVRTFGEFAALPALGVAARLGAEGVALQELARGEGHRRLRILEDVPVFEAETELDSPIELLDSLCFVFSRLLEELLGKLACHGMATNEIRVCLTLERAPDHVVTLRLPVPMSDPKALLRILHLELSGNPPPQAVLRVFLHVQPVEPRRTQRGLFAASSPEAERLETTLARVRFLVGKENVGSPYLLNTHRQDRFVMHPFMPSQIPSAVVTKPEPQLCLRRYRPPRHAQVLLENRRPVHLSAPSTTGRIATARGPWRLTGNWWREDAWNRDRWDVALDTGVLFRLFQEIDSGRWFIEGSYD